MEPLLVLSTNVVLIGILWKLCDIYKILKEVKRKDEKICPHCGKYYRLAGNGTVRPLCECGD